MSTREDGNAAVKRRDFRAADRIYSDCLDDVTDTKEQATLLCNRYGMTSPEIIDCRQSSSVPKRFLKHGVSAKHSTCRKKEVQLDTFVSHDEINVDSE